MAFICLGVSLLSIVLSGLSMFDKDGHTNLSAARGWLWGTIGGMIAGIFAVICVIYACLME